VARITDFGIATLAYSAPSHATSLIGSPEYMAPEVVQQQDVTGAADVYSAGILLYELLSGHTPFAGGSPIAVLRGQVDDPPPRLVGLPTDVWHELTMLLAKEPAARPRNAQVAAKRLRALEDDVDGLSVLPDDVDADVDDVIDLREADEQPTFVPARADSDPARAHALEAAPDVRRVRPGERAPDEAARRRWPWAAAVAIVLAGAGIGVWLATRSGSSRSQVTYTSPPVLQGTDVVVTRDWVLSSGGGDNVTVHLHIRNLGKKTLATFDEHPLVPPRLNTPLRIFRIDLRPDASTTVSYRSHVAGPLNTERVAQELRGFVEFGVPARLAAVTVETPTARLRENERAYLNLSGAADSGSSADVSADWVGKLLAGIRWRSSAPDVVEVQQADADTRPVLIAGRAGVADVTARVGDQTLVSHVTVVSPPAPAVAAPCEPGTTSAIATRFLDTAVIAPRSDPHSQYEIVGGARLPLKSPAENVQQVDDGLLDAIPLVPRDGTVLQTPNSAYWIVQAGYRFSATPDDLSPVQRTAAVTVPPDALANIPQYSPDGFAPPDGTLLTTPNGGSTLLHGPMLLYLGGAWRSTTQACSAASVVTLPASDPPLNPQ
jgi:hypothetical protein